MHSQRPTPGPYRDGRFAIQDAEDQASALLDGGATTDASAHSPAAGEAFGARLVVCLPDRGIRETHPWAWIWQRANTSPLEPSDVGFENFDWPTVDGVRQELESLGIGYGRQTSAPGRFYEYPGDPLANGIGTRVSHTTPA